jgi:hypothetical protein
MAKELTERFCNDCGFAIFVGWPHKCVSNKESTKPQKENEGSAFLVVGRPRVR